jgi:hypothetical protein
METMTIFVEDLYIYTERERQRERRRENKREILWESKVERDRK